jgi:antitoxin (DNA-binding transcriptional repressor) of toxin-antitoxin stability system
MLYITRDAAYHRRMVVVGSTRTWTVTEARTRFSSLIADAQSGQIAHISSNGKVAAHIVPANAWIIDDQATLNQLISPVIAAEAKKTAAEDSPYRLNDIGDPLGRVLSWAWRTDPERVYMRTLVEYVATLSIELGRLVDLREVLAGIGTGLDVCGKLTDSEIAAALAYTSHHWKEWWSPPTIRSKAETPPEPEASQ